MKMLSSAALCARAVAMNDVSSLSGELFTQWNEAPQSCDIRCVQHAFFFVTKQEGSVGSTAGHYYLSKADMFTFAIIEHGVPILALAKSLITDFQIMIRTKKASDLQQWLE